MIRGKLEAKFSIVRKMSENHARKKFKLSKISNEVKPVKNISQSIKNLFQNFGKKDFLKL